MKRGLAVGLWGALVGLALLADPRPSRAIPSWSPLDGYQAELKRQCPDKRLDRLDARGLGTVLQAFRATLPAPAQGEIDEAQAANCSAAHNAAGAACETSAAVGAITEAGRLQEAVAFVCAASRCADASACTPAP